MQNTQAVCETSHTSAISIELRLKKCRCALSLVYELDLFLKKTASNAKTHKVKINFPLLPVLYISIGFRCQKFLPKTYVVHVNTTQNSKYEEKTPVLSQCTDMTFLAIHPCLNSSKVIKVAWGNP